MAGLLQGLRAYPTLLRVGLLEAVAYRAEMLVWMLTTTMPLVSMALWSSVAAGQRIGPEGYGSADFTAYFLLTLIVRLLTGSWVLWSMTTEIRGGEISQRLLRPVHPILAYSAENLGAIPLRGLIVLPICLVLLGTMDRGQLALDPLHICAFLLAVPGAWALTFLSMCVCGALAFYIESALALFQIWMGLYMLFSGYLVPLPILPGWLRPVAEVLPFRYMVDFPVRLLLRASQQGDGAELWRIGRLLGLEYAWVLGVLLLCGGLWRAGLRRYAAFGA